MFGTNGCRIFNTLLFTLLSGSGRGERSQRENVWPVALPHSARSPPRLQGAIAGQSLRRAFFLSFDAAELGLVGCYLFSVTVTTNRINISSFPSCLCRSDIVVLFPHRLSLEVTDEVKAIF